MVFHLLPLTNVQPKRSHRVGRGSEDYEPQLIRNLHQFSWASSTTTTNCQKCIPIDLLGVSTGWRQMGHSSMFVKHENTETPSIEAGLDIQNTTCCPFLGGQQPVGKFFFPVIISTSALDMQFPAFLGFHSCCLRYLSRKIFLGKSLIASSECGSQSLGKKITGSLTKLGQGCTKSKITYK